MNDWIDVHERRPNFDDEVLIYVVSGSDAGGVMVADFRKDIWKPVDGWIENYPHFVASGGDWDGEWSAALNWAGESNGGYSAGGSRVTHWIPLPQPPEMK